MKDNFDIWPIGFIRKDDDKVWLEIKNEYLAGLLRLDEFSHVITIWWISKMNIKLYRTRLQFHPRVKTAEEKTKIQTPLCGVFATRSPSRPNPIGLTTVKIIEIIDNKIYVDRHDAFDGTPILDLKPYLPKSDCILNVEIPDFFDLLQEKRLE